MKKRSILLSAAFAGVTVLALMGNTIGPAHFGNGDRTGRVNANRTCGSAGCHAAPSAGVSVSATIIDKSTHQPLTGGYVAGTTYEVRLLAVNSVNSNSKFGFQVAIVDGQNRQAGNFSTTGLNPDYHIGTSGLVKLLEHNKAISAAVSNEYEVTFDWEAPAVGTGTVTLWAIFNGVNGNGIDDAGDVVSMPFSMTIEENTNSYVEAIAPEATVSVYPNPVTDYLNISLGKARSGSYTVTVYDLRGRNIHQDELQVSGSHAGLRIPATDWKPGMYIIRVASSGASWAVPFVRH
jgi:hypothetical protein